MATTAPKHLTAAMRVARSHLGRNLTTIDSTRSLIERLADDVPRGNATRELELLAARFEKATGVTLADLARLAKSWPA